MYREYAGAKGLNILKEAVRKPFSIIRQSGVSSVEERIAAHVAMLDDIPISSSPTLEIFSDLLREGRALPIGSVDFMRNAMDLSGITEPANISYPSPLRGYLRRDVKQRRAGNVLGHWFIKPLTTKTFTGFVFDTLSNPDNLDFHDRAQYNAFLALSPETPVWISEPVVWLSEYRYYISHGKVLGRGRYDDGEDETPAPDISVVIEMVDAYSCTEDAPTAYSIDVGVLKTGETALIECNDAWALGYYQGTLSHRDYIEMLWTRWKQLFEKHVKTDN